MIQPHRKWKILSLCGPRANNIRRHGWPTSKATWVKDLCWDFGVVAFALICLAIKIVYDDHRDLVAANAAKAAEIRLLKTEIIAAQELQEELQRRKESQQREESQEAK